MCPIEYHQESTQSIWIPDAARGGYKESFIVSHKDLTTECSSMPLIDYGEHDSENHGDGNELLSVVVLKDESQTKSSPFSLKIKKKDIQWKNPPKYEFSSDLANLTFLNEGSVLHNLNHRYLNDHIYTYSGLFLLSINPYKTIPTLYSQSTISYYQGKGRSDTERPHIFAIADDAYQQMMSSNLPNNQSILVTGESGAGKTENTKKIIEYLASLCKSGKNNRPVGDIDRRVLSTNPIIESFGNAKTIRNDNSSRFGKFIRLDFNSRGYISGAFIECYLLEKSRVTHQNQQERSFHIFYQIIRGVSPELRDKLGLTENFEDYRYLGPGCSHIDGVDDSRGFSLLVDAFNSFDIREDEQFSIYSVIAAILHLGNIEVTLDGNEESSPSIVGGIENRSVKLVCRLLGFSPEPFIKSLLRPTMLAGKEKFIQGRSCEQIMDSISTFSRALYERLFFAIISRLNQSMEAEQGSANRHSFIGILDMAGFEIFEQNSFEQLCINYTNERLQQFFNHHMFISEQEEYCREGIDWKFVDFGLDLQPTIDLLESHHSPPGIFSLLDEECVMPKATDGSFTEKVVSIWKGRSQKFDAPRFTNQLSFHIKHYAGRVEYSTHGWLSKNKDPSNESLAELLSNSSIPFINILFKVCTINNKIGGSFRTLSQTYREQLTSLMNLLISTEPHFVRCLVPNRTKSPLGILSSFLLDQLRCNGVLEGIRICRQGYPNRCSFTFFRRQYSILTSSPSTVSQEIIIEDEKIVKQILSSLADVIPPSSYQFGNSKIFMKAGVLGILESLREKKLSSIILCLQARCKCLLVSNIVKTQADISKSIVLVQAFVRQVSKLHNWPWWSLLTSLKPFISIDSLETQLLCASRLIEELSATLALEKIQRGKLEEEAKDKSQLLTAEIEKSKDRILALENSISGYSSNQIQLKNELLILQERNGLLEDESLVIQNSYNSIKRDYFNLYEEKKRIDQLILDREIQREQLESSFMSSQKEATKLRKEQEELSNQLFCVSAQKESLHAMNMKLESDVREKSQECQLASSKLLKLQDLISQRDGLLKKAQAQAESLEFSLKSTQDELEALKEQHNLDLAIFKTERDETSARLLEEMDIHSNYKKMAEDTIEGLRADAEFKIGRLNESISEKESKIDQLEQVLQQSKQDRICLSEQVAERENNFRIAIERLEQENEILTSNAAMLSVSLKQLSEDINEEGRRHQDVLNDLEKAIFESRKDYIMEIDSLKDQLLDREKKLSRAEVDMSDNSLQFAERISELEEAIRIKDSEAESMKEEILEGKRRFDSLSSEFMTLQILIPTLEDSLRQFQQSEKEKDLLISFREEKVSSLSTQLNNLKSDCSLKSIQIRDLERSLSLLKDENSKFAEANNLLHQCQQIIQGRLDEAESEREDALRKISLMVEDIANVREELENSKRDIILEKTMKEDRMVELEGLRKVVPNLQSTLEQEYKVSKSLKEQISQQELSISAFRQQIRQLEGRLSDNQVEIDMSDISAISNQLSSSNQSIVSISSSIYPVSSFHSMSALRLMKKQFDECKSYIISLAAEKNSLMKTCRSLEKATYTLQMSLYEKERELSEARPLSKVSLPQAPDSSSVRSSSEPSEDGSPGPTRHSSSPTLFHSNHLLNGNLKSRSRLSSSLLLLMALKPSIGACDSIQEKNLDLDCSLSPVD